MALSFEKILGHLRKYEPPENQQAFDHMNLAMPIIEIVMNGEEVTEEELNQYSIGQFEHAMDYFAYLQDQENDEAWKTCYGNTVYEFVRGLELFEKLEKIPAAKRKVTFI